MQGRGDDTGSSSMSVVPPTAIAPVKNGDLGMGMFKTGGVSIGKKLRRRPARTLGEGGASIGGELRFITSKEG